LPIPDGLAGFADADVRTVADLARRSPSASRTSPPLARYPDTRTGSDFDTDAQWTLGK
jgi:hypothetical protein